MKMYVTANWVIAWMVLGSLHGFWASAADMQASTPSAPGSATNGGTTQMMAAASKLSSDSELRTSEGLRLSPAAAEILNLTKAGISKPVIEAYIKQAPITRPVVPQEVIELNKQGVPDDLILALLKRASASLAPANQEPAGALNMEFAQNRSGAQSVAPSEPESRFVVGGLDPESYEFWWYHYAYPRALAAANERLFSAYRPFFGAPLDAYGF